MTSRMRVSPAGLDLIKSFEGFREAAARLPDGRWIVGYGHVRTAREGVVISQKDAEELLQFDLKPVEEAVQSLVFTPLRQNQFDALVSLAFNISPGQFKDSEVLRALNAGDEIGAANHFDAWRRARINGRILVVDALVRRRAAEKSMFLAHPDGPPSAPTPVVTPELDPGANVVVTTGHAGPAATQASAMGTGASQNVAQAVERIASQQPERVRPATVPIPIPAGFGEQVAAVLSPRPAPPPASEEPPPRSPEEQSRLVAARIARIMEKAEQDGTTGNGVAEPQAARPSQTAAAAEVKSPPEFDAATAVASSRGRVFIDDTEIVDPLKAAPAKSVAAPGRAAGDGAVKGTAWSASGLRQIAPWFAFLAVSVLGLGVSLFATFSPGSGTSATASGALAATAVFTLLTVVSIYFIASRGPTRGA